MKNVTFLLLISILSLSSCSIENKNDLHVKKISSSIFFNNPELLKVDSLINNYQFEKCEKVLEKLVHEKNQANNIEIAFLNARLNHCYKRTFPSLYEKLYLGEIGVHNERDSFLLDIIRLLQFDYKNVKNVKNRLSYYETKNIKDVIIMQSAYFVLAEYYQTAKLDVHDAISYSTKLLSLCNEYSDFGVYYFSALENLINLEVINRDVLTAKAYAEQYEETYLKYHNKNIILQARALSLNGFILCYLKKPKEALASLKLAFDLIPSGGCFFDKQEILKLILFLCNNYKIWNTFDHYIEILDQETSTCQDYCNINKMKGVNLFFQGYSKKSIPLLLNAYDYIIGTEPLDKAQLGSVIYYLYSAYLKEGEFANALNTYFTETMNPLPKEIGIWDKTKIFEKSKKESTYYFMPMGYYARVFFEKYKVECKDEDLKFAKVLLDSSMALIQNETAFIDEEKLLTIFNNSQEVYDLGVRINAELYELENEFKYLNDLYQCSEENKLKILYSLVQKKDEKTKRISQIQKVIDSLILTKGSPKELLRQKRNLKKIGRPFQSKKETNLLSKVQNGMDDDELIIDYNIVENKIFTHYIYKDYSIVYQRNFSDIQLSMVKDLISYQQDWKSDTIALNECAKKVYTILFPIQSFPKKVSIIPDQILTNLNFEILRNKEGSLMIDNHIISYSGSGIQYITNKKQQSAQRKKVVAFFYTDKESNLRANSGLDNLAGNIYEKKYIRKKYKKAKIYSGKNNTKHKFLQTIKTGPFNIVHIGTHGFSSKGEKKDIRLFFRDQNYSIDSIFGYDLLAVSIPSNLVILSSCESGSGLSYDGEGKFDLARYFILAGANSIISSLWTVDDEAAQLIYYNFYGASDNLSNKEKIRDAKLKLKKISKFQHPYFWGSFIYSN